MNKGKIKDRTYDEQENQIPETWAMAVRILMTLAFAFCCLHGTKMVPLMIENSVFLEAYPEWVLLALVLLHFGMGFILFVICQSWKNDRMTLIPIGLWAAELIWKFLFIGGLWGDLRIILEIVFGMILLVIQGITILKKIKGMFIGSVVITCIYGLFELYMIFCGLEIRMFERMAVLPFCAAYLIIDLILLRIAAQEGNNS